MTFAEGALKIFLEHSLGYVCFFPFFPSLNMIHICKNFLCLILMGMKKCLCYYVLFSFFHEYHFALNMKHIVKVA